MNKRQILFLCLVLFKCTCAYTQSNFQNYKFSSIGVNEGLSQNSVWDIIQTHDGFIWIGTSDGINRYDGTTFKVYKHEEGNSCTITGQNLPRLYEDKNNNLWESDDKGISVYNKAKDCFENIYKLQRSPMRFNANSFIGEDEKGGLIVFVADRKLLRIDVATHQITKVIELNRDYSASQNDLTAKPIFINGIAWFSIGTQFMMELNLSTLKPILHKHPAPLGKAIIKHGNSELFFIIGDTICIFNTIHKKYTYSKLKGEILPPHGNSFLSVNEYKGLHWYCSVEGIYIFDPIKLQFVKRLIGFSNDDADDYAFSIASYTDYSGNLWVCTNGDGVKLYAPSRNKFKHYKTKEKKTNLVKAVCRTTGGFIYTAPYRELPIVYDEKTGKFDKLKIFDRSVLKKGTIYCISPLWDDCIVFIFSNSLYLYDYQKKQTRLLIDERKIGIHGFNTYPFLLKTSSTQFYANLGGRILKIDLDKDFQVKYRSIYYDRQGSCTSFQFDEKGRLWIGAMNGIHIVDTLNKTEIQILKNVFVKAFLRASDHSMYIATQDGLYLFKGEKLKVHYTTLNGLPADFTYGLLEDRQKRIWVSHNKGLSCYEPLKGTFKNFTIHDGLQSSEFNTGAYFKDEEGKLYFGGINGINVFDPDSIISNQSKPLIQFTSIKLFEEPLKTDTSITVLTKLKLPYDNNTLSFDFAALEFSNSSQNQYAYMLTGYDLDWIYSGTKHYTRYANLPSGNYLFKVKAANADGVWNEVPKTLEIIITPPFWRTAWFYLLMVILAFSILGAIVYLIIKRQRNKLKQELEVQQKLEGERLRIARDLHDNVGAQLSYLITNIDWMLENPDALNEQETIKRLNSLSDTGKQAILTLRQTIWAINNKELSVEDFADRFKQFALKMLEYDKSIQLQVEENIDENNMLRPGVALNLFRICQEAFNNCIKHASCKNILIRLNSNADCVFEFVLEDDGKGFDLEAAKKTGHYGLHNMNARAEETGAQLVVSSILGQGTRLHLELR